MFWAETAAVPHGDEFKVRCDFMTENRRGAASILSTYGVLAPTQEAADAWLDQVHTALSTLGIERRERQPA
jgi:hypothetical protein